MPERYSRTAPTVVAEIAAEAAIARIGANELPDLEFLQLVEQLTADKDMIDEVRAKLHKAIGLTFAAIAAQPVAEGEEAAPDQRAGGRRAALAASVHNFKRALQLNANAGVKKNLDKAERELAKEGD